MNDSIQLLQSHASIRQFTDQPISEEQEELIVRTAQRSPTSSNLHAYSVISIRNPESKTQLAALCGNQGHIIECPLFLVFCADLYRLKLLAKERGYAFHGEYTEPFVIATVDAALVASRALIAAQALGMGGVMVGAIRNNPEEVSQLLELPELVYPVMGMSLGYPRGAGKIKPRLPLQGLWFKEKYQEDQIPRAVQEYDETMDQLGYLQVRPVNPDKYPNFNGRYSWSEHSARRMADSSRTSLRAHLRAFLEARGFLRM